MTRKRTELAMKGGKSPRQRIWEAVRANRKRFTQESIAEVVCGLEVTISQYFRALVAAEIIEVIAEEKVGKLGKRKTYRLVRDNGVEAPRVKRDGSRATHGAGYEAVWGTMHRLFERNDFSCAELASFASTPSVTVAESSVTKYVKALHAAGYLDRTQEAVSGGRNPNARQARYRLKPSKYTGPRAPIIQRPQTVYDANEGRIVWADMKEFEDAE
ncbi:hypothetical protein [Cupriavidus taiwanensis]|uniref:hypothetical protein n=1 Tax=Cupriavidus taiwanensis TaxID=164546 RepID=UPI000470CA1C|nr:hypothetical protein [Cupriavidus taiwanensis]SOZ12053.1 conserved protein of unknown function [Cupriavidus taiwanensis]